MWVNEHRLQALYRQRHIPTHGAHMGSHKMCTNNKPWAWKGVEVRSFRHKEGSQSDAGESLLESGRQIFTNTGWETPEYCWFLHVSSLFMSSVWSSLANGPHGLLVQSASDYRRWVYHSQPALPAFLHTDNRNQIMALFILVLAITKLLSTWSLRLTAERITERFCAQNWNGRFWFTKKLELSTITYWKLLLRAFKSCLLLL